MKLNKAIMAAAAGGMLLTTGVAGAATDSATATATVMTSIAITNNTDLDFGAFSPSTGGTVIIGTDGARSKTGAVVLSSGDTGGRAQFTVTGATDATYAITLPGNGTVSLSNGGGGSMDVNDFVSNPSGTGTLTGGTETLYVGATLTVGSGQASGSYTGSFDVSVEYN